MVKKKFDKKPHRMGNFHSDNWFNALADRISNCFSQIITNNNNHDLLNNVHPSEQFYLLSLHVWHCRITEKSEQSNHALD